MVYPITYRRPERVSRPSTSSTTSAASKQRSIHESVRSGNSGMSQGIPEALSFDRIIAGGVCPVSPLHVLYHMPARPSDCFYKAQQLPSRELC
jgi:hypothetical protein